MPDQLSGRQAVVQTYETTEGVRPAMPRASKNTAPPAEPAAASSPCATAPTARTYPREFIQTGVSTIDGLNSLVRGQKLPIFSGSGLPHNRLAAQIVRQAKFKDEDTSFSIVFTAMGVSYADAKFFRDEFANSGVLRNVVMFVNLADDFNRRFVGQGAAEDRSIEATLNLARELISAFPRDMLTRVSETELAKYYRGSA